MKKAWAFLALLAAFVLPAAAQSNELIDRLLEQPRASFGAAAYLVLAASGELDQAASEQQALAALSEKGWKLRAAQAEEPIRLGEFCFLIMKAFGEKGGLMYRLVSRTALRGARAGLPRAGARQGAQRAPALGSGGRAAPERLPGQQGRRRMNRPLPLGAVVAVALVLAGLPVGAVEWGGTLNNTTTPT